ncbi:MFS transporter [Phytoactinopolyspora limicola]|uniref:MFS transporter n=1 Tax=Phytoactinopolyspora limicola TaxID=2715536 RepID=UPI00140DBDE9|nr:MFS transporter [Phytoactinopolyspora limicola]
MTSPPKRQLNPADKRGRIAWAVWDWGSQSFNSIILTFVFTVYLTEAVAADSDSGSRDLGIALAIAGAIVAVLAPVTGQRSDARGRRKLWLGVHSVLVIGCMAAMFFVQPDPSYLLLGLILIGAASIFSEFAGVNYNAMLIQVSTRETIGRVSGFGWAMGYFGGLTGLVVVLFAFVQPDVGLFGVTSDDGMDIRAVAVFCAVWFAVFAVPLFVYVPEAPASGDPQRQNILASYALLGRRIARMWRDERRTLWFLGASAIYRDGLAAIFTFAGVIAAGTFGFSSTEVIVFAIAANLAAGIGAMIGGLLDDRLGPKTVIVSGLTALVLTGTAIVAVPERPMFWAGGLVLASLVGPIQSASRTFLARITPAGLEGEAFGLYATMGRAVSFTGPLAFSGFIALFGAQRAGMVGILLVLVVGLVAILGVRPPQHPLTAVASTPAPH